MITNNQKNNSSGKQPLFMAVALLLCCSIIISIVEKNILNLILRNMTIHIQMLYMLQVQQLFLMIHPLPETKFQAEVLSQPEVLSQAMKYAVYGFHF